MKASLLFLVLFAIARVKGACTAGTNKYMVNFFDAGIILKYS